MTTHSTRPLFAVAILLAYALPAAAAEFFTAGDGDDANPGSRQRPFRTITKAADVAQPGDTCTIRAGVYRETVWPKRPGTEDAPIRFRAWPGDVVVLSGTEPVRSDWTVHRAKIYKTTVPADFSQLFVDGQVMIEARWPNMRFDQRFDKSIWAVAGEGSKYGTMVDPALAETDVDWTGAVATLNVGSWQTWRRVVRNHRPGADRFDYDRDLAGHVASKRRWAGFDRYYLCGKLAALDRSGEWHLDRDTHTLYLWTPDGRDPAEHRVEVKARDYALEARGCEHIELDGLHFFAATFRFDRCNHCTIDGCHLRHPTIAARLEPAPPTFVHGTDNTVRHCSIVYADGPAITIRGANNTLENCLIHDVDFNGLGRGLAVDVTGSDTSIIRRCTVFNMGSSEGLRVPVRGPSIVEYNHVYRGGLVQSDGALIQSHGILLAGTVIRYNWVHDHEALNFGGNGIRGDDLTRNLLVHHNVVWNCREKGIIVKGDHNRVYNNTCFANEKIDVLAPSRPEPLKSWNPKQHPHLLDQQNANTQIANNCAPVISGTFSWQKEPGPPLGRMENNYTGAQPKLVDPAKMDFRPQADSPLVDAGRPIPGITDGHRGAAPDIGAYEHGTEPWIPGYRNRLWVSAASAPADGELTARVALLMPPLEPVRLVVSVGQTDVVGTLLFTPENWMQPQTISLGRKQMPQTLRFHATHLGSAEVTDPPGVVIFDR
ncbi:MAG: right-handed parallel beta-helix repeat-containing protein [Candidatus Nealsonbacteria bacterium]|nr:right-handed parallel beta-helix repeat-containing protein [Candidatus Nealsonbacteria bacterium]